MPDDRSSPAPEYATTWIDWLVAHGWWTTLIAGGLLCAVAVGLA